MKTSVDDANPRDERVGSISRWALYYSLDNPTGRADVDGRVLSAAAGAGESAAQRVGRKARGMQTLRPWARVGPRLCTQRWALLILFLLGVCGPWTEVATAQGRQLLPKVGELWSGTESLLESYRQPYVKGMRELGWIDGQTATFVVRYDQGNPSRLPSLGAELLGLGIDVLVVNTRALPAARKATSTVPIVCLDMFDPVAEGVTSTLARPGGNVTGVSWQSVETGAKRLELAKELLPRLKRVAVLTDATDAGAMVEAKGLRKTAARTDTLLRIFAIRHPREFPATFAAIERYRPSALIVSTNTLTILHLGEIVRFASSNQLPTFSEAAEFAEAGILLTYGPNVSDTYRRGALQVDRILKGTNLNGLPFEQPTKFELVVNMKTAKALGLTIPHAIISRATRVLR
jgi:putative tryptophan/tyrosine transport system substrate-binding protein